MSGATLRPLWRLLDIPDEAIVHMMETSLRRAGVYSLDDLAFLSTKDVEFPSMVKPVFVRKFRTICEYHAMGYTLTDKSTMQDILIQMNPRLRANPAFAPTPPVTAMPLPQQAHGPTSPPPPPPLPEPAPVPAPVPIPVAVPQTLPRQHLNVVIIGDCAPYQPCWEHMQQFALLSSCRIHSLINTGPTDESLLIQCRTQNIRLLINLEGLNVPQPNLYILGSTRMHDVFALMDLHHPPSAILMDLPGTVTYKSLQAFHNCSMDHACPIYLNLPRVVAPYVQHTLQVAVASSAAASSSASSNNNDNHTPHPMITWYHKQTIVLAHMASEFRRGRLFHSTALDELVMCVMYLGVKVESITKWSINPGLTERRTMDGITDYIRAAFSVVLRSGVQVCVVVDRNAAMESSMGMVTDSVTGQTVAQFDHLFTNCHLKLKRRLVRSILEQSASHEILPSVRMGMEALRLADMAEKHFEKLYIDLQKSEKKTTGILRMLSGK